MRKDFMPLARIFLLGNQTLLPQTIELLETLAGRRSGLRGRRRLRRRGRSVPPERVAEPFRFGDRGKNEGSSFRRGLDGHGSKAENAAEPALIDGDVLDLVQRGLL